MRCRISSTSTANAPLLFRAALPSGVVASIEMVRYYADMPSRSWAKGVQRMSRAPDGVNPPDGGKRTSSWRTHGYRLLLPWSLTLLAYSNSFSGGLIYDSRVAIIEDPRVHVATRANVHAVLTQ